MTEIATQASMVTIPAGTLTAFHRALSQDRTPAEGPLTGMTFVITGTLPTLSRKQATAVIESAGGRVTGTVTRATDALVTGDDAGSKLTKARELGIAEWTEADLLQRAGDPASQQLTLTEPDDD